MKKTYLGDSVYAEIEHGMIKLTTNNGYADDPRNIIYLEPEVLSAFGEWLFRNGCANLAEKINEKNPAPQGQ
jgi:hypothetical protein